MYNSLNCPIITFSYILDLDEIFKILKIKIQCTKTKTYTRKCITFQERDKKLVIMVASKEEKSGKISYARK